MFHVLCGYLFSMASNTIDSFDPFNIFELIDFLLTPALFHHLRVPRRLARRLLYREVRCFEPIEAVMWKITTRGFTLEEVLIMAAMNLLTSADTAAKRENRPSQKSKGDQACN
jgi:hypothetical protein